jgi:ABC-type glycerol-3-phosphate transport system permease component
MATLERTQPYAPAVPRIRGRRTAGDVVLRVFIYALILLGALVVFIPFAWTISTSLKSQNELFVYPRNGSRTRRTGPTTLIPGRRCRSAGSSGTRCS